MRIPKVERYCLRDEKDVKDKSPEVFVSAEQVKEMYSELRMDEDIKGFVFFLGDIK